ncbi:hypothetical protein ACWDTT_36325 [Streptosporangium sandarakinum]
MSISPEVAALMAKINKAHGDGAIALGSQISLGGRYPSGSLGLDVILGGGWPVSQWVEVIGKESQGKTAIVLKTVATNQERDPNFAVVWIAAEPYDVDQAAALGVDNDRVLVVDTRQMELAYDTVIEFAASKTVDMIVIDSYPALMPDEENEKSMDEATMALGARLNSKFFRKVGQASRRALDGSERPLLGVMINQYRDAIGQFSPHGTPQTTPGGKAKNYSFYARVEVKKDADIVESRPGKGKVVVGQTIKLRTLKNKSAPPRQVATVDFYFRDAPVLGFSRGEYDTVSELVTYAQLYNVITRRGAYYNLGNRRWGPGKDQLLQDLRAEIDLQTQLHTDILAAAARPERDLLAVGE